MRSLTITFLIDDGLIFDAEIEAEVLNTRQKVPSKGLPAYNV